MGDRISIYAKVDGRTFDLLDSEALPELAERLARANLVDTDAQGMVMLINALPSAQKGEILSAPEVVPALCKRDHALAKTLLTAIENMELQDQAKVLAAPQVLKTLFECDDSALKQNAADTRIAKLILAMPIEEASRVLGSSGAKENLKHKAEDFFFYLKAPNTRRTAILTIPPILDYFISADYSDRVLKAVGKETSKVRTRLLSAPGVIECFVSNGLTEQIKAAIDGLDLPEQRASVEKIFAQEAVDVLSRRDFGAVAVKQAFRLAQ
jgi:hypothetical protein